MSPLQPCRTDRRCNLLRGQSSTSYAIDIIIERRRPRLVTRRRRIMACQVSDNLLPVGRQTRQSTWSCPLLPSLILWPGTHYCRSICINIYDSTRYCRQRSAGFITITTCGSDVSEAGNIVYGELSVQATCDAEWDSASHARTIYYNMLSNEC